MPDHEEDFEWVEPEEGGARKPYDRDDDSTEDAAGVLREQEEQLRAAGHLPEEKTEEQIWQEKAELFSNVLGGLGVYEADNVSAEMLKSLTPELAEKLNALTLESLYFETFLRATKYLGSEPITPGRVFELGEAKLRFGTDLEKLQLLQRQTALNSLSWLGIDSDQVMGLLSGAPEQQQNINRVFFYISSEPLLKEYRISLNNNADPEEPFTIEQVINYAQLYLNRELDRLEAEKSRDMNPETAQNTWDSISEEFYEREMHRVGSHIQLGQLILKTLRGETPQTDKDPFEI